MPRSKKPKKSPTPEHSYAKTKSPGFRVMVDENDSESENDLTTDEIVTCQDCKKTFVQGTNGIDCDFCDHWFCLNCSKLKKSVYQAIKSTRDNLMWFCEHCLTAFPGVKKMMMKVANLDDRVDKLETRVKNLEENPLSSNSSKTMEEAVRAEMQEIQDIENRKLNLICFNLAESESENIEDKKIDDLQNLKEIVEKDMKLTDSDIQIKNPVRIGKKDESGKKKARPLKFSVETFESKQQILKGNAKLRMHENLEKQSVYISPDLTKRQQKEAYDLRVELRYRKNVLKEKNLKISNGKIVQTDSTRESRFEDRNRRDGEHGSRTFTNSSRGSPPRLFRDF